MKYFLLPSLLLIIFISGCTQQSAASTLDNNVVTIKNFQFDTPSPISNTPLNINFDVSNNGDKTIPNIDVNFFDTPGFTPTLLECNNLPIDIKSGCKFTNVDSLDTRHVHIVLKSSSVASPTKFTVSISVNYAYSGSREATIPIRDPLTLATNNPSSQFSQSQSTVGPVTFDIQPLLDKPRQVADKTVTDIWAIKGQEFTTKFILKNLGNIPNTSPVNIPAGNLKFTLTNLQAQSQSCSNFVVTDTTGTSSKSVSETQNTLVCNFKPVSDQAEFTGIIKLDYNYNYQFIRGVDFEIQPESK